MGKAKLTTQDVAEIRRQYQAGIRPGRIAKQFKVTYHCIWLIANGFIHKVPQFEQDRAYIAQRKANSAVSYAIRTGRLPDLDQTEIICVDCKKNRATVYEHRDYRKPLEVEPVCKPCNRRRGAGKY